MRIAVALVALALAGWMYMVANPAQAPRLNNNGGGCQWAPSSHSCYAERALERGIPVEPI